MFKLYRNSKLYSQMQQLAFFVLLQEDLTIISQYCILMIPILKLPFRGK